MRMSTLIGLMYTWHISSLQPLFLARIVSVPSWGAKYFRQVTDWVHKATQLLFFCADGVHSTTQLLLFCIDCVHSATKLLLFSTDGVYSTTQLWLCCLD